MGQNRSSGIQSNAQSSTTGQIRGERSVGAGARASDHDLSDEGIGIDPSDLSGIFEPFRRTRASREMVPDRNTNRRTRGRIDDNDVL
jgi:hypothetical protein